MGMIKPVMCMSPKKPHQYGEGNTLCLGMDMGDHYVTLDWVCAIQMGVH